MEMTYFEDFHSIHRLTDTLLQSLRAADFKYFIGKVVAVYHCHGEYFEGDNHLSQCKCGYTHLLLIQIQFYTRLYIYC